MLSKECFINVYSTTNKCCGYMDTIPNEILALMYGSIKERFDDKEFQEIAKDIIADVKCYGTWLSMSEWSSRKKEIHTYFEGMKKLWQAGKIDDERMLEIYREYPDKAKEDGVLDKLPKLEDYSQQINLKKLLTMANESNKIKLMITKQEK